MHISEFLDRKLSRRFRTYDRDGCITTGDLLAAIRAYYFDEAPGSAGSWLLGLLDR